MRSGGWILFLLLFWGCQNPSEPLPYPLTITSDGVGTIHIGGSFDVPLLRGKLPGFELEKLSSVTSSQTQTILQLKRHDEPIAYIVSDAAGDAISEIVVLSPLIKNSHGVGINDPLVLSEKLHCVSGECRYADEPSVTYVINSDAHTIREITVQRL